MNEILSHDIKLLGLIMPDGDEFCSYFKELPEHFTLCENFRDLYRLKSRKRKESKENLEINLGMDVLIHDRRAKKYYYRTLKEYSNMNNMLKYFTDKNLYILKDEFRPKEEPETDEVPESSDIKSSIIEDDTQLIF